MPVTWLPTLAQSAATRRLFSTDSTASADNAVSLPDSDETPGERKPGQRSKYVESLAALLAQPTSAQLINNGEQKIEPGSRAFGRRQQMEQAGAQIARSDQDFKQALRAAREQQSQPNPIASDAAPQETKTSNTAPVAANTPPGDAGADGAPTASRAASGADSSTSPAQLPALCTGGPDMAATAPTPTNTTHDGPGPADVKTALDASTSPAPSAGRGNAVIQTSVAPAPTTVAVEAAPAPTAAPATASGTSTGPAAPISAISPAGPKSDESNIGFTAAKESAPPDPEDESDRARNIDRIVQFVRSRSLGDKTSATLRLDPPNLGTLKLHMDLDHNLMSLRMEPENAAAHALLSKHLDQLRSSLEAGGIQLVQVQIVPPTQPTDGRDAQAFGNAHAHGERHGSPATPDRRSRRSSEPASLDGPGLTAGGPQVLSSAAESRVNLVA